jgi:ABC-type Fe3+-hydroxamate transport system substrate-binding protein
MKKFALLLSVVFAAGLAVAQEQKEAPTTTTTTTTTTTKAPATVKLHDVNAEFVSADSAKKTITIKAEDGSEKTAPVEGKAVASLKGLKSGEKIIVTCRDNEKGEHQAVTAIKPAPAKPASK